MSTITQRTKNATNIFLFSVFVFVPAAFINKAVMSASILPLCIFSTGEYIATGEIKNSQKWVHVLEFGERDIVENIAKKFGINCRLYEYGEDIWN